MGTSELFLVLLALCVLLAFVIYLLKKVDSVKPQKPHSEARRNDAVSMPAVNVHRQTGRSTDVEVVPIVREAPSLPPGNVPPRPRPQDHSRHEIFSPPGPRNHGPQRFDLLSGQNLPPQSPKRDVRAPPAGRVSAIVTDTPNRPSPPHQSPNHDARASPAGRVSAIVTDTPNRPSPPHQRPNHDARAPPAGRVSAIVTDTPNKRDITAAGVKLSPPSSDNGREGNVIVRVVDPPNRSDSASTRLNPYETNVNAGGSGSTRNVVTTQYVKPVIRIRSATSRNNSPNPEKPGSVVLDTTNGPTLELGKTESKLPDARMITPFPTARQPLPPATVETHVSPGRVDTPRIYENRQTNTNNTLSTGRLTDPQSGLGRVTATVSDPVTPPNKIPEHEQLLNTHSEKGESGTYPLPRTQQTTTVRTETPTVVPTRDASVTNLHSPQTQQLPPLSPATVAQPPHFETASPHSPLPPPSSGTHFTRPSTGKVNVMDECVKLSQLTAEELKQVNGDVKRCSLSMNASCLSDAVARILTAAPPEARGNEPPLVIVQFRKTEDKTLTKSEKTLRKSLKIRSVGSEESSSLCRLSRFRFRAGIGSPLDFYDFTPYVGEYAPQYNPFTHTKDTSMRCEWKMCYCETSIGSTKCKNLRYAHILVPK